MFLYIHVKLVTWYLLCRLDDLEEISIQPSSAIEGDDVTLTCRAVRYLYTNLQWLDALNQTITSNVSSLQIDDYSISLSLRLHNVSQASPRGYKCQTYKLHKRGELKSAVLIVDGKLQHNMRT